MFASHPPSDSDDQPKKTSQNILWSFVFPKVFVAFQMFQ